MDDRLASIAGHLAKQLDEHEIALTNTNVIFNQLLDNLLEMSDTFQQIFQARSMPTQRIYTEIDADRSVGIFNVLWHSVSFTCRGNHKPLAIERPGRSPVFTGRILALQADFQEISQCIPDHDFADLLSYEVASLYVPADPLTPALMKVKQHGDEEQYLHQADASRQFLLKTLEIICGAGQFHEKDES
jgi:hypothetical protein